MKHEKLSISLGVRGKRVLALIVLLLYIAICLLTVTAKLLDHAEEECIQRLKDATLEYSNNYYVHAMSDREQLRVVADMLSVLMEEGTHDLHTHLAAFEQRGMLDWLQVLMPNGELLTGSGTYDVTDELDYTAEVARLPYISNISAGLVDPGKDVIRSAVPILENGEIIAVLYGVYDLTAGHKLDGITAYNGNAYTFVYESDTGRYILDGLLGQSTIARTDSSYEAKPGFDLTHMQEDLNTCREGYSAFSSLSYDGYMYIYYVPVGINNWMVMVSVPESAALAFAFDSRSLLMGTFGYLVLGVILYFVYLYWLDHKLNEKNKFISGIQSQLMDVYHKPDHFTNAMMSVASRTRGEALLLLDAHLPQPVAIHGKNAALVAAYQEHSDELNCELLALCNHHRKAFLLRSRSKQLHAYPQLMQLMQQHGQRSLALMPLDIPGEDIHQVMGVFTPKNNNALLLMDVLAPDYFIAANNIDFLTRLNIASTIDNLTKTKNRTSYHLQLENLCSNPPQGFACAYVDVNDLHAVNNRFGHDQGDAMLRTIASALMDACGRENVYRFGGDEFIVLAENVTASWIENALEQAEAAINQAGYTVSIGYDWAEHASNVDGMIRTAESRMYDNKYLFYQQKEKSHAKRQVKEQSLQRLLTGNPDIDAFLHVAGDHYRGVYIVNILTDTVREIIAHSYFHMALEENDQKFSRAFRHYMAENVDKQSRRSIQNFFDYKQINAQVAGGETPIVEYSKIDGERVRLTVHRLPTYTAETPETLWIIELT